MSKNQTRQVSRKVSLLTFFGMFVCGVICVGPTTYYQEPRILMFFWMFPIGLLGLLPQDHQFKPSTFLEITLAILWLIITIGAYPLMCVIFFRLRTKKAFFMACLALALLLLLNVAGCRRMIEHFPRIE